MPDENTTQWTAAVSAELLRVDMYGPEDCEVYASHLATLPEYRSLSPLDAVTLWWKASAK